MQERAQEWNEALVALHERIARTFSGPSRTGVRWVTCAGCSAQYPARTGGMWPNIWEKPAPTACSGSSMRRIGMPMRCARIYALTLSSSWVIRRRCWLSMRPAS